MEEELTIEQKAEAINDYNECVGNEIRVWLEEDMIFVCYNALSAMDEIYEVDETWLNKQYQKVIENTK